MARLDFEDFLDTEVTRVYLAGDLSEAARVEKTLTVQSLDYMVVVEPYSKLLLGFFPSDYAGAGFYVLPDQAALARAVLLSAGLKAGIEEQNDD